MTNSLFNYDDDASPYRAVDPWDQSSDFSPTPGDFGRTPYTSYSLSPTPDPRSRRTQSDCLAFLSYDDWGKTGA
ncbi:hypothetical protein BJY00DRAFT_185963 [Aspergillus carlsbadensis]|nr:hypothetical protein BJY00DRAFT_185963 [Aspergillus carlsbadensis]